MIKYCAKENIDAQENITLMKYVEHNSLPEHTHDFIEIQYIWSGSGIQVVNGTAHTVERGDLLFFDFTDKHAITPHGDIGIINCLIHPKLLADELVHSEQAVDLLALAAFDEFHEALRTMHPIIKFTGKELLEIETIFEFMVTEFEAKSMGYKTVLKAYAHILLTKIFRVMRESPQFHFNADIRKMAPDILKYIEEHYHEKISLKTLSQNTFYNPSYFSKVFKECFGKNLTQYIAEKRIHEAIRLMDEKQYSIEKIMELVGFGDKKQFYAQFKKITGTTPRNYGK